MSKIDDYYDQLFNEIDQDLKAKQYEDALIKVEDEINQPYVPNLYYNHLLSLKEEIIQKINENNYQSQIEQLSKLQIWDKIYDAKNHEINLVYLNLFFSKYENDLEETDYALMQKIFLEKNLSNEQKTILVSCLMENNINYNFAYFNAFTNTTATFNPALYQNQSMDEVFALIEKQLFKDPSKLQIANSLLQVLVMEFFPNAISYKSQVIIDTILNMVDSLFNQTTIIDNEISAILKKHIGYDEKKKV